MREKAEEPNLLQRIDRNSKQKNYAKAQVKLEKLKE